LGPKENKTGSDFPHGFHGFDKAFARLLCQLVSCCCRDRSELQNLIAALQEQKSHHGEKSRSATPSTIESDIASIEGLSVASRMFY